MTPLLGKKDSKSKKMYSSYSVSKRFVLVPILVVLTTQFIVGSVSSLNLTNSYLQHKCLVSQGKYKPGSQYEKFLNEITQSLSKSKRTLHTGYSMMAYGEEPDMIAVTIQCRIDSRGPKCGSCIATAQSELRKRCPGNKGALIWYDQCLVEFSTYDTTSMINYDDNFCIPNPKNLSSDDTISFLERHILLDNLTQLAVTINDTNIKDIKKPVLYAAGEKKVGKVNLYGMVQCTADLSVQGCNECMMYYTVHFQDCWRRKQGVRVLSRSCNYRYEIYPFINPKGPYYTKF